MGNSSATLVISTDRDYYIAGEVLTGTVYLDVNEPRGVPASSIHLEFRGEEVSSIGMYRANETFREESKGNIVSLNVALTYMDGMVDYGQYEFPFEAELPRWLPSSMLCEGNADTGSHCDIVYTLEAYTATEKAGRFFRLQDPVATRKVLIIGKSKGTGESTPLREPLPAPFSEEYKLFSLFCFPRGRLKVVGEALKAVQIGKKLWISLECSNDSKTEVKGVEVEIREHVTWRAGDTTSTMSTRESMHRVVAEESIPVQYLGFCGEGPNGETRNAKRVAIRIPMDTRASYEGKILDVKHELVATVSLQGPALLTTIPKARLTLKIESPANPSDYLTAMSEARPLQHHALIHGGDGTSKQNPLFCRPSRRGCDHYNQRIWHCVPEDWAPLYVAKPVVLDLRQAKMGGVDSSQMF